MTNHTVHFELRTGRAICGANNGRKYRHYCALTTDAAKVTCPRCLKSKECPKRYHVHSEIVNSALTNRKPLHFVIETATNAVIDEYVSKTAASMHCKELNNA